MSKELQALKELIQREANQLICETHPEACRLRDENYAQFEQLVLDFVFQETEPVSVQTAMAQLEQELGTAFQNDVE